MCPHPLEQQSSPAGHGLLGPHFSTQVPKPVGLGHSEKRIKVILIITILF